MAGNPSAAASRTSLAQVRSPNYHQNACCIKWTIPVNLCGFPTPLLPTTVAQTGSTVYSTCVATRVKTKGKADRKHVRRSKSVTYHLIVLNKVEEGLCLENICVRVDLPAEVMYAKSRLAPPFWLRNATAVRLGGRWRQRKPDVAGRLVHENGTASVLWSGVSLGPGKWGHFSVKMKVLSGPVGRSGTLAVRGSVYKCTDSNSCKNNVPPTPVRHMVGWDGFHELFCYPTSHFCVVFVYTDTHMQIFVVN